MTFRILGIGTDLCSLLRIQAIHQTHGARFVDRILHPLEQELYHHRYSHLSDPESLKMAFLAKRFAAKEAISKAIGTGIGRLSWHDLSIFSQAGGAPQVLLSDHARHLIAEKFPAFHAPEIHLSLSDEYPYAQAFALLQACFNPYKEDQAQQYPKEKRLSHGYFF